MRALHDWQLSDERGQKRMMKETQNKPEQERKSEKAVLSGRQKLLIRAPWTIRIIGVIGMVFGGLMSFWCYRDT